MVQIEADFVLFDLDGTLIDSTPAVIDCFRLLISEAAWTALATQHGIDPATILATSHGRRTMEVLKDHIPKLAVMDFILGFEASIPNTYPALCKPLPAAKELLTYLQRYASLQWAIVTSGTRGFAENWLCSMDYPVPKVFITAEGVQNGKPDPEGYTLAKTCLNKHHKLPLARVIVFEDAPAGIKAGKAANAIVIAVCTSHTRQQLIESSPDYIVDDLTNVAVESINGAVRIMLTD